MSVRSDYDEAIAHWAYTIEHMPSLAGMLMGKAMVYREQLGIDMNEVVRDLRKAQAALAPSDPIR